MWGLWQVHGDGRELVATIPEAIKIRAEDGRRVDPTKISNFISNLPFGAPCCLGSAAAEHALRDTAVSYTTAMGGICVPSTRCQDFARRP